jgi:hypothetical protein
MKDKLKAVPVLGRRLRMAHEHLLDLADRTRLQKGNVRAVAAGLLGKTTPPRLTVAQQWKPVLMRSLPLLAGLGKPEGPPVLFATLWGGKNSPVISAIESVLATAVRLRGVEPVSLMCGGLLPACIYDPLGNHRLPAPDQYAVTGLTGRYCKDCVRGVRSYYRHLPVTLADAKRWAGPEDLRDAIFAVNSTAPSAYPDFTYRDVAVGRHALASMYRTLGRGTLEDDHPTRWLFRRFLVSGALLVSMAEKCLAELKPRRVVCTHGIYIDHGTFTETARKMGVPVAVFALPYRRETLLATHGDTYHRALVTEPVGLWENLELGQEKRRVLWDYVESKRRGTQDRVTYHPNPIEERDAVARELGLDPARPVAGLFTNVMWDAQIYHAYNAFPFLLEWIRETIQYFAGRPDIQLVVRIHPAEVKAVKQTSQPVAGEIRKWFPSLPENVRVVPPESDLSSYTLAEMCRAALVYGTKMGLEIALRGVPVVIAGESIIRGKGFTLDASSKEEYYALLDRINTLPRNAPEIQARVEKYAWHFYFRRTIPFPFVSGFKQRDPLSLALNVTTVDELLPGRHRGLDRILDGILRGEEFVVD